ncbi:NUDIX hydrolase [Riemerella columbina]|uniref:NUDIX hydrolase n=1 Tax=Riemerella columbina TaxID=103810 RepID=UPI00266FC55E|nr:NUDIX domain-containing protein [Riemerella columbina]WKS95059.1 NUDIX domain-containing protein [Riemerella columbina]
MTLQYCPHCGKPSLKWINQRKFSCDACGFVLYQNCAAAVAVLLTYRDEILLTRRNQEPKKGFLDLSGGFCDPNETAEQTCARELWEELQLTINPEKLQYLGSQANVYPYKEVNYNTVDLFYRYALDEKPDFNLEEHEINAVVWLKKDELNLEELAFESQKRFLNHYLKTTDS